MLGISIAYVGSPDADPEGDPDDDYFTTSPSTGTTNFGWDDRGNRTSDDSTSYSHDARNYTYEGRKLVRQITGKKKIGNTWYTYTLTNAYDHKGRRVFKSYLVNGVESHYFYYFNLRDQLIEVKYTPNIASSSTYSLFEFFWAGDRPIAYYQVDYPSVTTTRRYFHSDADNRVYELWTWPTSGTSSRVWALQPDAFGWDQVLLSNSIYQPLRGANSMDQYDVDVTVWNDSNAALRPPLVLTPPGYYDPLTATMLEVDARSAIGGSASRSPVTTSATFIPAIPCAKTQIHCGVPVPDDHGIIVLSDVVCSEDCSTGLASCTSDYGFVFSALPPPDVTLTYDCDSNDEVCCFDTCEVGPPDAKSKFCPPLPSSPGHAPGATDPPPPPLWEPATRQRVLE